MSRWVEHILKPGDLGVAGFILGGEPVAAQLQEAGQETPGMFLPKVAQQVGAFLGLEGTHPTKNSIQKSSKVIDQYHNKRKTTTKTPSMSTSLERITMNPRQCGGRPCIRGMRIRVSDVLDLFAAGLSAGEILEEMPDLEPDDLKASLLYASRKLNHPVLVP